MLYVPCDRPDCSRSRAWQITYGLGVSPSYVCHEHGLYAISEEAKDPSPTIKITRIEDL